MSALLEKVDAYIDALRNCLASAHGFGERNSYSQRLSAADSIREALDTGKPEIAYAIVHEESRAMGWDALTGDGAQAAHAAFIHLSESLLAERLNGRPNAEFGRSEA